MASFNMKLAFASWWTRLKQTVALEKRMLHLQTINFEKNTQLVTLSVFPISFVWSWLFAPKVRRVRYSTPSPARLFVYFQAKRPQSAGSASASLRQKTGGGSGLTSEEIKIVRRTREEFQRRGGWIRIFPSPDSWDLYGCVYEQQKKKKKWRKSKSVCQRQGQGGSNKQDDKAPGPIVESAAQRIYNRVQQCSGTFLEWKGFSSDQP